MQPLLRVNALENAAAMRYLAGKNKSDMINCKEFELDDLLAITAIPVGDYALGTKEWQLKPTIPSASLDIEPAYSARTIVVGQTYATKTVSGKVQMVGSLIPIRRLTGKAKDTEGDSVAGRLHTVTVNCKVDDRDGSVWDHLLTLERTPSHLVLTFRGGTRAFVSATIDTYTCEVERDGADTSLSFKIYDLMGIQLITT